MKVGDLVRVNRPKRPRDNHMGLITELVTPIEYPTPQVFSVVFFDGKEFRLFEKDLEIVSEA